MSRRRTVGFGKWWVVLLLAVGLALPGCGGGGGGGTTTVTGGDTGGDAGGDTGTTSEYEGAAKVVGTVSLSNLTEAEQEALAAPAAAGKVRAAARGVAVRSLADAPIDPAAGAAVMLYVIGDGGELVPTGIRGTIVPETDDDGNPTGQYRYEFDGVRGGVNYIVRYLKEAGDGQVFELKARQYVPEEADAPGAPPVEAETLDKLSTALAEMIVDAVVAATDGTGIDDETVEKIVDNVIAVVEEFVQSIAPQIFQKEMVVEADDDTLAALEDEDATELGDVGDNDDLAGESGRLLGDDEFEAALNLARGETRFALPPDATDDEKRAFVAAVFEELLDDGDVPGYMVAFLADRFVAGDTIPVGELRQAVAAGLVCRNTDTPEWDGLSGAIAFHNQLLSYIYAVKAYVEDPESAEAPVNPFSGEAVSLDEAHEFLADVPPIFLGLFPEGAGWEAVGEATELDVPQAIAFTILVLEMYLPEDLRSDVEAGTANGVVATACGVTDPAVWDDVDEAWDVFDFNSMVPGSIMAALGFYDGDPPAWQAYAAGPEVVRFRARSQTGWLPADPENPGTGNWSPVEMLTAEVCLSDLSELMAMMEGTGGTGVLATAQVFLSYPTVDGGPGEIELTSEMDIPGSDDGGEMDRCFVLDPWYEKYGDSGCEGDGTPCFPDPDRVVSDFASGAFQVTVQAEDGTELLNQTFPDVRVLTGMQDVRPAFVTPRGSPDVPYPDENDPEFEAKLAAHQAAWDAYFRSGGASHFPANQDTDGDGEADAARVTVTWNAPEPTPEQEAALAGLRLAYSLSVGKNEPCEDDTTGTCWTWEDVWNSWDEDRFIYGTSFTIPEDLPVDNGQLYNLNLEVVFLDDHGEMVGQGGAAHAEFWVDDPIDPEATVTISGTISGSDTGFVKTVGGADAPVWVSLFYETWDPSTAEMTRTPLATTEVEVNREDGSFDTEYQLVARVEDLLDVPPGAWVGLNLFVDEGPAEQGGTEGVWDTELQAPEG